MVDVMDIELQPDLLLMQAWDEEGETASGIWVDHVWEDVAGHAFGRVVMKAYTGTTGMARAMLQEIQPGDLVLFTRAAHENIKLLVRGEEMNLILVNVLDCQTIITDWENGSSGGNSVDGDGLA